MITENKIIQMIGCIIGLAVGIHLILIPLIILGVIVLILTFILASIDVGGQTVN